MGAISEPNLHSSNENCGLMGLNILNEKCFSVPICNKIVIKTYVSNETPILLYIITITNNLRQEGKDVMCVKIGKSSN